MFLRNTLYVHFNVREKSGIYLHYYCVQMILYLVYKWLTMYICKKICIKSNMAARKMVALLNLREFILNIYFKNLQLVEHLCQH